MATCLVYICLTVVVKKHLLAYALSYIIVLRLWRLGRLYRGTYSGLHSLTYYRYLLAISCQICIF